MTSPHHNAAERLADQAYHHTWGDGHGGPVTCTAHATEAVARALLALNTTLQTVLPMPAREDLGVPGDPARSRPVGEPALGYLRAALGWDTSSYWKRTRIHQIIEARDLEVRRQWSARIEETGRAKGWSTWASAFLNPDNDIDFTHHAMPSTESIVAELRRADRQETLRAVRQALLGTTDGGQVDDSVEIPAGEISRILTDLETNPATAADEGADAVDGDEQ